MASEHLWGQRSPGGVQEGDPRVGDSVHVPVCAPALPIWSPLLTCLLGWIPQAHLWGLSSSWAFQKQDRARPDGQDPLKMDLKHHPHPQGPAGSLSSFEGVQFWGAGADLAGGDGSGTAQEIPLPCLPNWPLL